MSFGWTGGGKALTANDLKKIIKDSSTVDFTGDKELYAETILIKEAVDVVSSTPILLDGLQEIDGYLIKENDRVLVTGQENKAYNGIYIASTDVWERAEDCSTADNIKRKMEVAVVNGIRYEDTTWELDIKELTVILDTTPLIWRISKYADQNGRKFQFDFADWINPPEIDFLYIEFKHYQNSLHPVVTIFEENDYNEPNPTHVDRIEIVDADTIRIYIPDMASSGIDLRFRGYIIIEPTSNN